MIRLQFIYHLCLCYLFVSILNVRVYTRPSWIYQLVRFEHLKTFENSNYDIMAYHLSCPPQGSYLPRRSDSQIDL